MILNPLRTSGVMKDEIFGPILPIVTYQTIDEAIKYIKDGDKPLSLYYFGNSNGTNSKRVQRETSSGSYVVNDVLFQLINPDLPFGGVGYSGYGKYHGYEGFKSFSNAKSVFIKPAIKMYPYNKIYPPFTADKQSFIKFLMRVTNTTQCGMAKRLIAVLILICIIAAVATGKLNKKTFINLKRNGMMAV